MSQRLLCLLPILGCLTWPIASFADEGVKDDFRGLKTGMSRDEAMRAAASHGGRCDEISPATVAVQATCTYGKESRAFLYFTPKGHASRIRIIFFGDFDELDIQQYIIKSYSLLPDPLSQGLYKNKSEDRFTFSRMGTGQYAFEIINRQVALKDNPEPKARLPQL